MKPLKSLVRAAKRPRAAARTRPARLVIHIGDHKTGSTSIQYAFARGQVRLGGAAVAYPTKLNHSFLRKQCSAYANGAAPARAAAEEVFRRLARRIATSGAPAALISAEALENVPPGLLHEVVTGFFAEAADEIRVVAYVRPHAARFLSNYAEQIKIGSFAGDLEAYFAHVQDKGRLDYQPRFAAHRAAFGDAFLLRPMIREQLTGGDILADFAAHAFPGAELAPAAGTANESLSLEDLMRLKLLQARLGDAPQKLRHALGWEFARLVADLPPPQSRTRLQLHAGLAGRLHEACLADARALDAGFFGGQALLEGELTRARDGAVPVAQPTEPAAWFSAAELRTLELLSDLVAGQLEADGVNWVQELRRRRLVDEVPG